MRTTLQLNNNLYRMAKQLAAQTHRTLTAVIEDALRTVLERKSVPNAHKPFKMRTFKGTGTAPGVNLDDTSSLMDILEAKKNASYRR